MQKISKIDVEIATVLKRNLLLKSSKEPGGLENLKEDFIQKNPLGVVYKVHEDGVLRNNMLYLQDSVNTTSFQIRNALNILSRAKVSKLNTKGDIKYVSIFL